MNRLRTYLTSGAAVAACLLLASAALASTITVPNGAGGGTCGAGNQNRYEFGGNCGSLVSITDTNPAYVQDNSPAAEGTYRVRFYANFDGKSSVAPPATAPVVDLSMAGGDAFDFFVAYDGADPVPPAAGGNAIIRAELSQSGANRVITIFTRTNAATEVSVSSTITGKALRGWRSIEINWAKATTAGGTDGVLQAWIDGTSIGNLTNVANGSQTINHVRWGAVNGLEAGTTGTFKLDDFVSQRTNYIGPVTLFSDVPPANIFFRRVTSIHQAEVIPPCGAGTYCPTAVVTRKEQAKFMLTSFEGTQYVPPACTVAPFTDVPISHPYCAWIAELKLRNITAGCGGGNYCPDSSIDRQQMVVLIPKTNGVPVPPACTVRPFPDVLTEAEGNPFCKWIKRAADTGLTVGCGGGNFCPLDIVDRGQMSTFLGKEFSLPFIAVGP